ncbi:MAG: hypothetical protein JW745_02440 [Sedimentisphaerales bacterium]|nr:hypothetical protein [Sedimentisphaerales bacterium]MBN2843021.1 hypothetical protein [Sedimentisphaerales bacterium]
MVECGLWFQVTGCAVVMPGWKDSRVRILVWQMKKNVRRVSCWLTHLGTPAVEGKARNPDNSGFGKWYAT